MKGMVKKGMAHLLEHLVFKGTPSHKDIPNELTERGARANGTTNGMIVPIITKHFKCN